MPQKLLSHSYINSQTAEVGCEAQSSISKSAGEAVFTSSSSNGPLSPWPETYWYPASKEIEMGLLLLILVIFLLFGGGGYYGYSRWGTGGGLGIIGTLLLIVLVLYLLGAVRI